MNIATQYFIVMAITVGYGTCECCGCCIHGDTDLKKCLEFIALGAHQIISLTPEEMLTKYQQFAPDHLKDRFVLKDFVNILKNFERWALENEPNELD